MSKQPTKTWTYEPNLEDEKEYVVEYEIINLQTMICKIFSSPHGNSPIYKNIIIPHLKQLVTNLQLIDEQIIDHLEEKNDIQIMDIIQNIEY